MERNPKNPENVVDVDELVQKMAKSDDYGLEDISSYTGSISSSSSKYSSSYESTHENHMLGDIFSSNRNNRPKRGRRPLRPYDPIRKKTEEKDKYWLRAFRSHIRTVVESRQVPMAQDELEFWEFYVGPSGKPGKGHKFLSYGKKYKNYLFTNSFYISRFRSWFDANGESLLAKKYEPGSAEWFVFYDYAARDLYYYSSAPVKKPQPEIVQNVEDEFELEDIDMADNIL